MKTNFLVSVIMPCYNASVYLRESLESVLVQSYENLQVILVNDGSTDDTEEIIKSYSDKRIKYFNQENKGQCAASNLGIAKSTGNYIKFFDADDIMNPEHIELQLAKLAGSDTSVASCEWGRFYDGKPDSAIFNPEPVWKDMEPLAWLKASLRQKYDMMGACLWLIPRPLLEKVGGWDERLSLNNDFEFSIRLLLASERVLFTEGARVYYRSGMENALSQIASHTRMQQAIHSTDLGCNYLLQVENTSEMRRICANRYQLWLHRVYPTYPDLVEYLEKKIIDLGGSDRILDGGRISRLFTRVLGWKNTSKIKIFLKKIGYKKLPGN